MISKFLKNYFYKDMGSDELPARNGLPLDDETVLQHVRDELNDKMLLLDIMY
jgi:hypothetical protein